LSAFLRVTLPLAAVNFLNQASRAVMGVIGPLLAVEFALSASDLGLLAAALFMGYAAAQLPVGLALDLYGARRVQVVLALVAGAGFALSALAEGPGALGIGRFLTGLGISAGLMAMLKANTQWFPRDRVAAVTGTGVFVGALGGMVATLPLGLALPFIGWRGGFLLLAGTSALVALWILLSVPDRPPGVARPARRPIAAEVAAIGRVFTHPHFVRYAPAIALIAVVNFTWQGLWAGPWLRDVAGLGDGARATVLFAYAMGAAAGSLATGQLASLAQARGMSPFLVSWFSLGAQFAAQGVLVLDLVSGVPALCALWAVFAFCGASSTAGYTAVAQGFGAELAGRVATAINFSMLCAVFALQYGIGAILDLWPRAASGGWDPRGYAWAFGVTMLAQAAAVLWLLRKGGKE